MTQTVNSQIHLFLAERFPQHTWQDDEDIFASGFVNSLFAMQLILYIEQTFDLNVSDADLEIDNFRTINAIEQYVQRKRSEC